jgi:hypothetical protein
MKVRTAVDGGAAASIALASGGAGVHAGPEGSLEQNAKFALWGMAAHRA